MASLHKIQTFKLSLPKSDIFLDLDFKESKSEHDSNSNKIKVITLERPLPKLVIEPERRSLLTKTQDMYVIFKTKANQLLHDLTSVVRHQIIPRLSGVQFCGELLLSNFIACLCVPIIVSWVLFLLCVRWGVMLYLKLKYKDKYQLMNGTDAAWGLTKFAHDNCFTSYYIIQGNCSISKIRNRIKTSLIDRKCKVGGENSSKVEYVYHKMRSNIVQKCGFFCWENFSDFDITKHVIFLDSNEATRFTEMDEDELTLAMKKFLDTPLPEGLPQWVIYVIPRFKRNSVGDQGKNHYAMIWRINHSIMDGVSAIHSMQTCIADNPVQMSIDAVTNPLLNLSWIQKFVLYFQIVIFGSRTLIKSLVGGRDKNCFQGPELSGPKTVTRSRPICFQSLKQVKNVMGSSVTAVLMSSFGGALRKLALKKNLPVPERIFGGATSAVLPYPDFGPQNRFTLASYPLNVEQHCPIQRLKTTMNSVQEFGGYAETVKNFNMVRLAGLHPVIAIEKIWSGLQATFLLSNVPGPAEKYTIFQGDSVVDLIAWNTIKGKTGMGLCLLSYGGKTSAALICDGAILPNPMDVETLIKDFESELLDLAKVCGIPEELMFGDK